jgi:predicted porin
MKHLSRPLLAVALCGCATALHAQSSVTLYGRVDVGLGYQSGGTTPINASNGKVGDAGEGWQQRQGSAGRLGFRGTEDLGGGLSANFQMEARFDARSGVPETPFFQARSFVELASKSVGAVYLGREYIPAFWPALRLDPWGFDTVGTPGPKHQFANYTVPDSGIRSNNTVGYKSPTFNGISGIVAYSFGEGTRSNSIGANIAYASGPVYLAAAFDRVDANRKLILLGGSYDFGVVRVGVTLSEATVAATGKNRNISLTGRIPVGPHAIKLGVSRLNLVGADNTNTRFGLGYEHALSKRTSLLANVGSAKQGSLTRTSLLDFTLKHNF